MHYHIINDNKLICCLKQSAEEIIMDFHSSSIFKSGIYLGPQKAQAFREFLYESYPDKIIKNFERFNESTLYVIHGYDFNYGYASYEDAGPVALKHCIGKNDAMIMNRDREKNGTVSKAESIRRSETGFRENLILSFLNSNRETDIKSILSTNGVDCNSWFPLLCSFSIDIPRDVMCEIREICLQPPKEKKDTSKKEGGGK